MREAAKEAELRFEHEIQQYQMQYEELWMRTHIHWERIKVLEAERDDLTEKLRIMTANRDNLDTLLKKKTKDFEELDERFKNKVKELIQEKHAHKLQIEENQRLEEEIKNLKQQITELNQ